MFLPFVMSHVIYERKSRICLALSMSGVARPSLSGGEAMPGMIGHYFLLSTFCGDKSFNLNVGRAKNLYFAFWKPLTAGDLSSGVHYY